MEVIDGKSLISKILMDSSFEKEFKIFEGSWDEEENNAISIQNFSTNNTTTMSRIINQEKIVQVRIRSSKDINPSVSALAIQSYFHAKNFSLEINTNSYVIHNSIVKKEPYLLGRDEKSRFIYSMYIDFTVEKK